MADFALDSNPPGTGALWSVEGMKRQRIDQRLIDSLERFIHSFSFSKELFHDWFYSVGRDGLRPGGCRDQRRVAGRLRCV